MYVATPAARGADPHLLTLPAQTGPAVPERANAMMFHDPRSKALLLQLDCIARSDAPVLVAGETGTGKELVARHIHKESGRRGPFLAVNCGALSESLIDAELFGHESGAFTGASAARAGWFEAAQGGTLFLDEIGDLALALQVKLLRVLQERQVVRLGSRKPIALDVRLVAATNIDLARAVEAQHFRADLFWRLSVAMVDLPPLRARPGDILPLARHFIGVYAPRLRQHHAELSAAAQAALLAYAWPGNIRELENVVHFGLIVARNGVVEPQDLRLASIPTPPPASPAAAAQPAALQAMLAARVAERPAHLHREVEAALVRAVFAEAGGNQVQAARLLGVTRNTLRTLLKRHGLLAIGDAPASSLYAPAPSSYTQ